MNTDIAVTIVTDGSSVEAFDAIESVFMEFDRIVKTYTRFDQNSELSKVNKRSGEWVELSVEFFDLVKYMIDLAKKTNGIFDPTIIDLLEMYGYNSKYDFSVLDDKDLFKRIQEYISKRPSWKEIELDTNNRRIKMVKGQRIELGGVGKGYALDQSAEILLKNFNNFLIDAGGDILAYGLNEKQKPWRIGLKSSKDEVPTEMVELKNESLASSGSWARRVKNFHHLIDPVTGKPKETDYKTVFVLAPKAIDADAWATSLFVGGSSIQNILPSGITSIFR